MVKVGEEGVIVVTWVSPDGSPGGEHVDRLPRTHMVRPLECKTPVGLVKIQVLSDSFVHFVPQLGVF